MHVGCVHGAVVRAWGYAHACAQGCCMRARMCTGLSCMCGACKQQGLCNAPCVCALALTGVL